MRVAVLLTLLFSTTLGAAERRVVFGVVWQDKAVLEPIAMLGPIAAPPREDAGFAQRYFDRARRYDVYREGQRVGSARPDAVTPLGCVPLGATADVDGFAAGPDMPPTIATNFPIRERAHADRDASEAQLRALRRYARFFLRDHGVADVGKLDTDVDVIDAGDEELVVGSFAAKAGGSLFLVARAADVSDSQVRPQVARFRPRADDQDVAIIEPYTHVDLDGDGFDEVLARDHGKEGYEYVIFRRAKNGKWAVVYGGASGC